jgi:hypothetical protein
MSEYQEEVLTNLLDLQAELRGDEPEPHDEKPSASSGTEDGVTVAEGGVSVSVPARTVPTTMTVNERLVALNERLARLELELAGVTRRIERIEPDPQMEQDLGPDADPDAPWRSFLDLQKIVADRLDHD